MARNLVRASTTKRAQSRRKQLEKMERLDKPQGDEKSAHFLFNIQKESGNVVLQLTDGAIGYENVILSEPIELDIRKQEAIALVGPNGIGKSTLLKSIIGQIPLIKGDIHLGSNVSIGYYDQGQADLHSNKTIYMNFGMNTRLPLKEKFVPFWVVFFSQVKTSKSRFHY